jgi:4-hydroxythreonine-4-phosphate dehydrogenase
LNKNAEIRLFESINDRARVRMSRSLPQKKSSKHSQRKFIITTGDVDGIGLEVTYKALLNLKLPPDVQLSVFEPELVHKSLRRLREKVLKKYRAANSQTEKLILLRSSESPAKWVFDAAKMCRDEIFSGMITAPLSKTLIRSAGFSEIGHTEILSTVSKVKSLHMGFLGHEFNVVLATGHIPIRRVPMTATYKILFSACFQANKIRARLAPELRKRPIALVGLNPHAGENGLIGHEENKAFRTTLRALERKNIHAVGPLVPDAAFLKQNWSRYSIFVCPYHDQGLIPFKLVHGADSGAHVTLGLPFIRTSVDHGTAKDIFGKGIANPNSMRDAIEWAIKLANV